MLLGLQITVNLKICKTLINNIYIYIYIYIYICIYIYTYVYIYKYMYILHIVYIYIYIYIYIAVYSNVKLLHCYGIFLMSLKFVWNHLSVKTTSHRN